VSVEIAKASHSVLCPSLRVSKEKALVLPTSGKLQLPQACIFLLHRLRLGTSAREASLRLSMCIGDNVVGLTGTKRLLHRADKCIDGRLCLYAMAMAMSWKRRLEG
jgi:hypothetical protein